MYLRSVSACLALVPRKKNIYIGLYQNWLFHLNCLKKLLLRNLQQFQMLLIWMTPISLASATLHSTETALVKLTNDILMAADDGKCTLMVLRDLSFEDVDHGVLVNRLNHDDISGSALDCFKSNHTDRCFSRTNFHPPRLLCHLLSYRVLSLVLCYFPYTCCC